MELPLKKLRLDERCQARADFSEDYAEELAEFLRSRDESGNFRQLPPGVAFRDGAATFWLADGFHRYRGHELAGRRTMLVDVLPGDVRAAVLFAVGSNTKHGLRRTNADKRKAALILLEDEEWRRWSGREIARRAGVSEGLVRMLRERLEELSAHETQMDTRTAKRNGTTYTMKFRDMTAPEQRQAVENETERHRPAWKREAQGGLEQAERALVCLGGAHAAAPLEYTRLALNEHLALG